jgi:6-hydroxycyclohex-1-ene-1-carbonyl-CoA dehydrogenase
MSFQKDYYGYRLTGVGQPLERFEGTMESPGAGEVVVRVAGCGVCHTDLGFALDGVPTRKPLPLVLGHEISGTVVAAGAGAEIVEGQDVIVPAVIPCGECHACRTGHSAVCRTQFMPGNDGDGGFASLVKVPARGICPVPDRLPDDVALADLSVVADAVTTPYEAILRSGLNENDVAVFVGAGGVGGFGVQIAAAFGAAVAAIDIDEDRLGMAAGSGTVKGAVKQFRKESGRSGIGLKVFETSGTPQGQQTAFGLVDFGGYLAVVGFTPKKVEIRLSNLMALDATARGNWGCPPERYPGAMDLVLSGRIRLGTFVEHFSLDETVKVMDAVAAHTMKKRPVLVPDRNS